MLGAVQAQPGSASPDDRKGNTSNGICIFQRVPRKSLAGNNQFASQLLE
jgi:hypothetical protein